MTDTTPNLWLLVVGVVCFWVWLWRMGVSESRSGDEPRRHEVKERMRKLGIK